MGTHAPRRAARLGTHASGVQLDWYHASGVQLNWYHASGVQHASRVRT